MKTDIVGELVLPSVDGKCVAPGVYLIGEPTVRPDLGPYSLGCLANVGGRLCIVELTLRLGDSAQSSDQLGGK